MTASTTPNIAFIGLGAMGFGMASHLLKTGHSVSGFDLYPPSLAKFAEIGGRTAATPKEAAEVADVLICMVANSAQVNSVLFDDNGAVQALGKNTCIIISSTVSADAILGVRQTLDKVGREDIQLLDSPVSGGTVRAANGTLTILLSGTSVAIASSRGVLGVLSEHLYEIPGGIGSASNVKMINQLLAGVHVAVAAEAMGLAVTLGLNTREVYAFIVGSEANSWMFENRVPHMLDNDETPYSAMDILVKDMGIVTSSARSLQSKTLFPFPLSSAVEQLYILGSAQGLGRQDDSTLVRVFLPTTWQKIYLQAAPTFTEASSTGKEASLKLLVQLLSGVHHAAAVEALTFAEALGLDVKSVYEIIKNAAGGSVAFASLGAKFVAKGNNDISRVNTELGTVLEQTRSLRYPAMVSAAAFHYHGSP